MTSFRIILRYIFGIGIALCVLTFLAKTFKIDQLVGGNDLLCRYLWVWFILFVQFPAVVLLIIISVYTYLTQRIFWSLFKPEYTYLLVTIAFVIIAGLIETIF